MLSNRRIVIIGAGHVGTHCAAALSFQNICDEIVFIDRDKEKEKSQAMDLADSVAFLQSAPVIRVGDYKDCEDADIIVIAAGVPRLPGQTRLDTLGASVECIKDVVENLKQVKINGIVITITNPADIIADYVRKGLDLPKNQVFSTGTSLDTARTRRTVADLCNVDPRSVLAFAMGEHGDSSMVPFSHMTIFGKPYKEFVSENKGRVKEFSEEKVVEGTHMRGMDIINGKGSTEFGIGAALADMAKAVLTNEHRILPASTLLEGEYGQKNVHAGVPCIIGRNGIESVVELHLTEEENKQFAKSCDIIIEHIKMAETI